MNAPNRIHLSSAEGSAEGSERGSAVKRSLILAGGGIRVSYQAGVLRALEEEGLGFDHGDGTSGGIMNLGMLLSGLSPQEMCDRWRELEISGFISPMPLSSYIKTTDRMGMGDADGIVEKVFPSLGIDVAKINAAQGMEGTFNVCNYSSKTCEAISHRDVTLNLMVAGISLPIFMPPVAEGGSLYIDAVWIKDAHLMEAVRRGAEEIWLVWCIGNHSKYKPGFFNQYVHMIEMSANGALFEEFRQIRELNARIEKGDSPYGQQQPIRLHVIKPLYPLPLDTDLYKRRINHATLIEMGYADAKRYLATREAQGIAFTPEATKMNEPTLGITFRETMSGGFSLDETDPKEGHKKGRSEGSRLAIHATINIQDLDRFVEDPGHLGELTGNLDFTPFGENIPASKGVFNLFSPADDPKLKLMVYELGFEHEGQKYYFAGKKEVRDDPGFDLWKDTTTLYSRLHRGDSVDGEVIGAGVLSLGVTDLIKLSTTMRVTNAESVGQRAEALSKFGKFFLQELWDTYVRHVPTDD